MDRPDSLELELAAQVGGGVLTADLEGRILGLDQRFVELWKLGHGAAQAVELTVLVDELLATTAHPEKVRAAFFAPDLAPEAQARDDIEMLDGGLLQLRLRPLYRGGAVSGRAWSLRPAAPDGHLDQRIHQAQRMEAIGRLAGGIAHDFNNLLTVIRGYSDLCLDQLGDEDSPGRLPGRGSRRPLRDNVGEIAKAAKRASHLTRQLLAYSRQQVVEPQLVELNQELLEVEKMLTRVIGDDVVLRLELTAGPSTVSIDLSQMQQMVLNLVVNARDAMPAGGEITLRTEPFTIDAAMARRFDYPVEPGEMVMLRVRDTGEGIDPDALPRIFEPFFTTKDIGRGTGLGLSTVYGIVKQSGGYIWVESERGAGTEFQICLPAANGVAEVSGASPALEAQAPSGEKILVVDDDPQVREVVVRMLLGAGYRVRSVPSAAKALEAQEAGERFDLLIADLLMPEMDGNELARRMTGRQGDLAVLFISGYDPDAYERRGVLPDGAAFLHKPLDAARLRRKVAEVLG